ncbi:MAG: hypothetical protein CL464_11245 [Acidimicrobiaceae bacterium]|nr:hypothetical protein [Acidimicrobiaceae bacterium]
MEIKLFFAQMEKLKKQLMPLYFWLHLLPIPKRHLLVSEYLVQITQCTLRPLLPLLRETVHLVTLHRRKHGFLMIRMTKINL